MIRELKLLYEGIHFSDVVKTTVNQIYIENVKQIIIQCGKSHTAIIFGGEVNKR